MKKRSTSRDHGSRIKTVSFSKTLSTLSLRNPSSTSLTQADSNCSTRGHSFISSSPSSFQSSSPSFSCSRSSPSSCSNRSSPSSYSSRTSPSSYSSRTSSSSHFSFSSESDDERQFTSALHVLCCTGNQRHNGWDRVVRYLEQHSTYSSFQWSGYRSSPSTVLDFSPLNKSENALTKRLVRVPDEKLTMAGLKGEGPDGDDTPLRIAVRKGAPVQVIAALCQLFPESAEMKDVNGWLPLHHAVRVYAGEDTFLKLPPENCDVDFDDFVHDVIRVLIAAHPNGLISRDDAGRTPLHVLFIHHARACSVSTVEILCGNVKPEIIELERNNAAMTEAAIEADSMSGQDGYETDGDDELDIFYILKNSRKLTHLPPLPGIPKTTLESIPVWLRLFLNTAPSNAAVVPDMIHGCIPLHYAVMRGSSIGIIRRLLEKYPGSVMSVDRYGRTALGWYLGGSQWEAQERILENAGEEGKNDHGKNAVRGTDVDEPTFNGFGLKWARSLRVVTGVLLPELDPSTPIRPSKREREELKAAEGLFLHRRPRSADLISLLSSKSVACISDGRRRLPLHYAVRMFSLSLMDPPEEGKITNPGSSSKGDGDDLSFMVNECMSLQAIKHIIELNRQALVDTDIHGRTPLHTLFATAHIWNEMEFDCLLENEQLNGKLVQGAHPFNPPIALVELLAQRAEGVTTINTESTAETSDLVGPFPTLSTTETEDSLLNDRDTIEVDHVDMGAGRLQGMKYNNNDDVGQKDFRGSITKILDDDEFTLATHTEDDWGLLPIHYAAIVASPSNIIRALVRWHPMSVLHSTFELASFQTDKDLIQSSPWRGSRTPIHAAFSSPYTAHLQTVDTLSAFLESPGQRKKEERDVILGATFEICEVVAADGQLALKMKDGTGNLPLHIAARHGAKANVLAILLKGYSLGALSTNDQGDIPLHLLLDDNLFVNMKLFKSTKESDIKGNDWQSTLLSKGVGVNNERNGPQAELRVISARVSRLSRKGIGGAVLGQQHHGWTSDEDEIQSVQVYHELLRKVDLLLCPLVRHGPSLQITDSRHGMTALHIAVAFHVGYNTLQTILQENPSVANIRTLPVGRRCEGLEPHAYTPLDLHVLHCSFPAEISADDKESWHTVRELLFSYELFPMLSSKHHLSKIDVYRRDQDLLMRCAKFVKDEANSFMLSRGVISGATVVHTEGEVTKMEDLISKDGPIMLKSSRERNDFLRQARCASDSKFIKKTALVQRGIGEELDSKRQKEEFRLSDVSLRLWTFFTTFTNCSDPADHYGNYVEAIIADLDFSTVQNLVCMPLPTFYASEEINLSGITVQDCANVYCKAIMHSTFYFAGLYDFTPSNSGESNLLHMGNGGQTLSLRATEHRFTASTVSLTESFPGETAGDGNGIEVSAADSILGDSVDTDKHLQSQTKFQVTCKPVCIKFIRDRKSYEREMQVRSILHEVGESNFLVPMLADYDSTGTERISDKRYACSSNDPRFRLLHLSKGTESKGKVADSDIVDITQYPYAIVFPLSTGPDLGSAFLRRGADASDIKDIGRQIGVSLDFMHRKNIIYCNLRMNNMMSFNGSKNRQQWVPTDFSCSISLDENVPSSIKPAPLGQITRTGTQYFVSGIYPPEMFVKLSKKGLAMYEKYWSTVMSCDGVAIKYDQISPRFDEHDVAYVMKCHCDLGDNEPHELPPLPYNPVFPSKTVDLWSFGIVLFEMCSGGHSLFPTNIRTGHLSSLFTITNWNREIAEDRICAHINDPLAQDVLVRLLSPSRERESLDFSTILQHPFFHQRKELCHKTRSVMEKIIETRMLIQKQRKHSLRSSVRSTDEVWAEKRSVMIAHPSIDLRLQMLHSASNLIKMTFNATREAPLMPFCFVVLPYKLIHNEEKKLVPVPRRGVDLYERIGRLMLGLSKASFFVGAIEALLKDAKKNEVNKLRWADATKIGHESAAKMILSDLGLDAITFMDLASTYVSFIKLGIDFFLSDPIYMARKLIHGVIKEILRVYTHAEEAYLYLFDEVNLIPVVPTEEHIVSCYPHLVTENVTQLILKSLPFMQMTFLYARGISGSISGVVKILCEEEYPNAPQSWTNSSQGLVHRLDKESMVSEVTALWQALDDMISTKKSKSCPVGYCNDILLELEQYFLAFDKDMSFANMKLITSGEASLWTLDSSTEQMRRDSSFEKMMQESQEEEARKLSLEEKDAKIVNLEKALKALLER